MIQRKQTLYLIFVLGLFIPQFFCEMAYCEIFNYSSGGDKTYFLKAFSLGGDFPTYPLSILTVLITALTIFVISQYKKQMLQMRMTSVLGVLIAGFCIIEGYYLYQMFSITDSLENIAASSNVGLSFASILPLPALIFVFLAFKGITKDIMLLKSYNRMR